jgi:ribosome-associated protein
VRERLRARLDDVVEVVASDTRSQFRNRALARRRLRERIESALVEAPARRPTRPTRASRRQRVAEKRSRGELKRLRRRPGSDE